jgi:acid phosphatase type 7
MSLNSFNTGKGTGKRQSHIPPVSGATSAIQGGTSAVAPGGLITQAAHLQLPHFPFQPLPPANAPFPYRYDLSRFLPANDIKAINDAGLMVFHTVGDTGDHRGLQQLFVAKMMTQDADDLPAQKKPAFFYHLGDVVYFAGDIDMYGDNFYATYDDYRAFIVAIAGNHDCQPDDPQDGPVVPSKYPLDGWVQNFMSKDPSQLGSRKTSSWRTQMDLPNVFWTFTTPLATFIGLFSNVSESEGEFHQDQIDWFKGELLAADPKLALIVVVHHPPFSGDTEHTGSSVVEKVLFDNFKTTKRYPNLILSGHVHNYQRFTKVVQGPNGPMQIPCLVAGAGGYVNLRPLQKVNGTSPQVPLPLHDGLTLEQYDTSNFGFLRFEVSKSQILGTYLSDRFSHDNQPTGKVVERFAIDVAKYTVQTLP